MHDRVARASAVKIADPKDVLAYSLGALIAAVFWGSYYRTPKAKCE